MKENELIEVKNLKMYFPVERGFFRKPVDFVKAVDNVSFSIKTGTTLGLVGESGCGKTTLGRCLIKVIEASEGQILFRSEENGTEKIVDLKSLNRKAMSSYRQEMQMIFQDPYSSLDSRMTVFDIIAEPLKIAKKDDDAQIKEKVKTFAEKVGLNIQHLNRYPHAFSGGQRQRIGIARALITNPKFVVADEPVSALDVSIQAQILNLLQDVQKDLNLTILFVSHDLRVIHYICDQVAVMYVGKIVELSDTDDLYENPVHPYTQALLSAIPLPDPTKKRERIVLGGDVANPVHPPKGCYFHPRCQYCKEICKEKEPELREVKPGHYCACHCSEDFVSK